MKVCRSLLQKFKEKNKPKLVILVHKYSNQATKNREDTGDLDNSRHYDSRLGIVSETQALQELPKGFVPLPSDFLLVSKSELKTQHFLEKEPF